MRQMLKNKLKDQKGFTLIELLAVIVILGIIAAIAVPSILGIINHSKADAHIANAQQITNAAKIYIADEKIDEATAKAGTSLETLVTKGYLDSLEDPSGNEYDTATSKVFVTRVETAKDSKNYKNVYEIFLTDKKGTPYIGTSVDAPADVSGLKRKDVNLH